MMMKRAIKRCAGWAAVASQPWAGRSSSPSACILMYHRIAPIDFVDRRLDDWNVPPDTLERQIAALVDFADLVPLSEVRERLIQPSPPAKPLVALTFDDGYANFAAFALPVLQHYNVPATVFPVTAALGLRGPHRFDGWSQVHADRLPTEVYRPMNWDELDACVATGLVTVGSHSHQHLKGMECTYEQLFSEAEQSRSSLRQRLGRAHGSIYAYPYGSTRLGFVSKRYVDAVQAAGYEMAVTSDLGLVYGDSDPYLLPRVEAHALDAGSIIRAKVRGALGPYYLVNRLRRARRPV